MIELPRRTITDLIARYELEPDIKDVFVEGAFDKDIISCCYPDRVAYGIDSVDISVGLLQKHKLTEGNKQRVIALARELASMHNSCACRFLIDRDLDHWFGSLESTPRLIWTEYCSIELYFFSDELLRDLLITTAKSKITNWQSFTQSFANILRDLYTLRLTDRELGWSINWLPIHKYLKLAEGDIKLSLTQYINQLLIQNSKSPSLKQFNVIREAWLQKLNGDYRYFIRGHDFIELLAWSISKFNGINEFASSKAIERLLVLIAAQKKTSLINVFQ